MLLAIIITFVALVVIDSIYFGSTDFYQRMLGPLMKPNIQIIPSIFVWLLLVIGISIFVNRFSVSYKESFFYGAVFGLIVYGVYNLTNYATLVNWPIQLVLRDTIWGVLVMGSMAVLMHYIDRTLN